MTPGVMAGFCIIRALPSACRRRVAPLMVQIPPFGRGKVTVRGSDVAVPGGEVSVQGGEAPTSQATSAKNVDNGVLRLRRSAFGTQRCPAWHVARTRTAEYAREPLDTRVNLSICALAALPTCMSSS